MLEKCDKLISRQLLTLPYASKPGKQNGYFQLEASETRKAAIFAIVG